MSTRREVSRVLTIALALFQCITCGGETDGGDRSSRATAKGSVTPSGDTCWVFTHMNKAGGTTVKRLLRPFLDDNEIKYGLYDNAQWKLGTDYLKEDYLKRKNRLTWGGYTEGEAERGAAVTEGVVTRVLRYKNRFILAFGFRDGVAP